MRASLRGVWPSALAALTLLGCDAPQRDRPDVVLLMRIDKMIIEQS